MLRKNTAKQRQNRKNHPSPDFFSNLLGVKKGWSVTYGKKYMPKAKELLAFGERWRPYRTVASWYMWRAFERAGYKATNKIRPARVRKRKPLGSGYRRRKPL